MKRIKSLLILSALAFGALGLASCGGQSNEPQGEKQDTTVKYKLTFANTSMNVATYEAGSSVSEPAAPKKDGHVFAGWYKDAGFTEEVTFPFVINSDTTIYAQFNDLKVAYKKARAKTIGEEAPGYEYDYNLHLEVSYKGVAFNGNQKGNAKYAKGDEVSFKDEHENSGSLFYDGTKVSTKKGTTLQVVTLDEDGELNNLKNEEVDASYQYDSSSFAKAVFEYDDSKLKSIETTSLANVFKLNTSFNFSAGVALVANNVNNPIVERLLGELPETSGKNEMLVTFTNNGNLSSYKYTLSASVTDFTVSLTYELTFKNQGKKPTITETSLPNLSLAKEDIAKEINAVSTKFNEYKKLEKSAYNFKLKTGVDYGAADAEINATIQGKTKRATEGTTVYFWNEIEIDSDYKNDKAYKDSGLKDIKIQKELLTTGETKLTEKKALIDSKNILSGYVPSDNDRYYLFEVLGKVSASPFVQIKTDTKTSEVTYRIGISTSDSLSLLAYFNENVDLDPTDVTSVNPKLFGTYQASTVDLKDASFEIAVGADGFKSIELELSGKYETKFEGSKSLTSTSKASFDLDFTIEATNDASSFTPASK